MQVNRQADIEQRMSTGVGHEAEPLLPGSALDRYVPTLGRGGCELDNRLPDPLVRRSGQKNDLSLFSRPCTVSQMRIFRPSKPQNLAVGRLHLLYRPKPARLPQTPKDVSSAAHHCSLRSEVCRLCKGPLFLWPPHF